MSICVNAHCLMLKVLRYIALNALNTVQKIKAMSKMSKIDKVHIRGLIVPCVTIVLLPVFRGIDTLFFFA